MPYTSLFARPCAPGSPTGSPPTAKVTSSPATPLRHAIYLAVRPVPTETRPAPPSLFALRARPVHDVVARPLAVAA
jgi:hypothetical protein